MYRAEQAELQSGASSAPPLVEDQPVMPPDGDQQRLFHNALSVPLDDDWLTLRNTQEAASHDTLTELDLLRGHHIRLDDQVFSIGKPADALLDVLLRLPAGCYRRMELVQSLCELDSSQLNELVSNRMTRGSSVLRNVITEAGPLLAVERISGSKTAQSYQLLGGLAVRNLRGDQATSLAGALKVAPFGEESQSTPPIQLYPSIDDDPVAYAQFLQERKARIQAILNPEDIRCLEVTPAAELVYEGSNLDLTAMEKQVLDVLLRSPEPHRSLQIRVTLASLGTDLTKTQLGSLLRSVAGKTSIANGESLVVITGQKKGMRYALNPAVIIEDNRIKDNRVSQSKLATELASTADMTNQPTTATSLEALHVQWQIHEEQFGPSPEMAALIDMIEAYILEGSVKADGTSTGYYEPELITAKEQIALMQVFKRLDLSHNPSASEFVPIPQTLTGEQRAEREARRKAKIEQAARRDALAKRLYKDTYDLEREHKARMERVVPPRVQELANCRGVDPELFYPERGASTKEAKAVCRACVVKEDCGEYALTHSERGIWGGMSERERRKIRRERAKTAVASQSS